MTKTLLDARSVAYSLGGASGIYLQQLMTELKILNAVNARATTVPAGFTAEKLLSGEADLAVQQLSELIAVPGVEVVGGLPDSVQHLTHFSIAIFKEALQREKAMSFISHLCTPLAQRSFLANRLTPVARFTYG